MEMEEWKLKNGNERMEVKYSATKEWPFWATVVNSHTYTSLCSIADHTSMDCKYSNNYTNCDNLN